MRSTGLVFKSRDYIGSVQPPATVLEDESRFGNNGAFLGAGQPNWVQLPSGLWVLAFDGTDDYVDCGDISAFDGVNNKMHFSLWVRVHTVEASTEFMTKYDGASSPKHRIFLFDFSAGGRPRIAVFSDGDANNYVTFNTDDVVVFQGIWYLLSADVDLSAENADLFVNGDEKDSTKVVVGTPPVTFEDTGEHLFLGALVQGGVASNNIHADFALPRISIGNLGEGKVKQHFEAKRHLFGV